MGSVQVGYLKHITPHKMVDSVSIKVYCQEGDRNHIRRFCLDKDDTSSFSHLQEKLDLVFPQIRRHSFSILWTDDEGDMITVSNDEDLKIAFTDMKGPLYKFVIRMVTEGNSSEKQVNIHPGITCDGCQGKVSGFRYKCLVCEDFDLCKACEFSGLHPEHSVIRISNPHVLWPHQVFSPLRILNQLNEITKGEDLKIPDAKSSSQDPKIEGVLGPVFETMVKVVTPNKVTEGAGNNKDTKAAESHQAKQCIVDESDRFKKNSNHSTKDSSSASEYLAMPCSDNLHQKLETENERKESEEKAIDETPLTIEPEKEKNPRPELDDSEEKREESNENLPEVFYASYDGTLYPTRPENNPDNIVQSNSPESKTPKGQDEHPDPKINDALQAMLNMGFTNDAGWLTNLLVAKQGDIGNTLDVLKRSRN